MFGIGFFELVLILVVALLVLGPEGLPRAARELSRFVSEMRSASDELKQGLMAEEPAPVPRPVDRRAAPRPAAVVPGPDQGRELPVDQAPPVPTAASDVGETDEVPVERQGPRRGMP